MKCFVTVAVTLTALFAAHASAQSLGGPPADPPLELARLGVTTAKKLSDGHHAGKPPRAFMTIGPECGHCPEVKMDRRATRAPGQTAVPTPPGAGMALMLTSPATP